MSGSKKISPERAPTNREKFAFVKLDLDVAQQLECKNWKCTLEDLDTWVESMNREWYAISLKWDGYNKCFAANATMGLTKHQNYNLCLTGRGSTPLKALKQLMFKHLACDGIWPEPGWKNDEEMEFDD